MWLVPGKEQGTLKGRPVANSELEGNLAAQLERADITSVNKGQIQE